MLREVEELEYNSQRQKLIIPEYGRHVQKLIDHCMLQTDRDERNQMARAIVDLMGSLQPHLRDVNDFKHKLWDQLFIISDFKIDVDSPYEKPQKEVLLQKPEKLSYPIKNKKFRFYGNNIQLIIDSALNMNDSKEKSEIFISVANHMKKAYISWNKADIKDEVIYEHLLELSKGKVDLRNTGLILAIFKEKPVVTKRKAPLLAKRLRKKSSYGKYDSRK